VFVAFFPFENARKRIVLSRAVSFISQELFDLLLMLDKKSAIEKDKSARFAGAFLFARRANCRLRWTPVLVLLIPHK
jgi:hypothetical protein